MGNALSDKNNAKLTQQHGDRHMQLLAGAVVFKPTTMMDLLQSQAFPDNEPIAIIQLRAIGLSREPAGGLCPRRNSVPVISRLPAG